jgi:hypothetical protein
VILIENDIKEDCNKKEKEITYWAYKDIYAQNISLRK